MTSRGVHLYQIFVGYAIQSINISIDRYKYIFIFINLLTIYINIIKHINEIYNNV